MNTSRLLGRMALCCATLLAGLPALAQQTPAEETHQHEDTTAPAGDHAMSMNTSAPEVPRSPDYSEGFEYEGLPGFQKSDKIHFGKVLADELEFLSSGDGNGGAWTAQATYGGDFNKLWLRTQGLDTRGEQIDPTSGVEALWWHATSPFWGTLLGVRQDFGPGAHSWVAFGVEGLAPYWFEVEATGYIGDDGRLSGRVKASYDVLFTNRLIFTPEADSNIYSKAEPVAGIGKGLGNLELGLRLRYEVRRKFAPYVGYVWERSFAGTADLQRAAGNSVLEGRFVAGVRLWR